MALMPWRAPVTLRDNLQEIHFVMRVSAVKSVAGVTKGFDQRARDGNRDGKASMARSAGSVLNLADLPVDRTCVRRCVNRMPMRCPGFTPA
jgi:hypothetical protein